MVLMLFKKVKEKRMPRKLLQAFLMTLMTKKRPRRDNKTWLSFFKAQLLKNLTQRKACGMMKKRKNKTFKLQRRQ